MPDAGDFGGALFCGQSFNTWRCFMLYWAAVFLAIALIAAVFGFGGLAAGAAGMAKVLFFLFLILFVVSLFTGGMFSRR
jgi:uncharacterized membrane protein YtjA (UPF0391 family)